METKIKICGLRREEDILAVNRYLPEYAGFVFAKSRRQVTREQAQRLVSLMDKRIAPVGVFVNGEIEEIAGLVNSGTIRVIQLHGDEDEAYIRRLREKTGDAPVIKAVRVQSAEQIFTAQSLPCDGLLLDTYVNGAYGGSGECFDKAVIPQLEKPYFLAGGLSAGNVRNEIAKCSPYGVDVSSAVETDGWKDAQKINAFICAVRE